jgi:hypothetical protein
MHETMNMRIGSALNTGAGLARRGLAEVVSPGRLALIALLGIAQPVTSNADDLFQLFWRGTAYKNDSTGHIIAVSISEQDFVNKVAADNGLNPTDLVFVYRPNKRDTAVVRAANGQFVADVIQMEVNFTDVVNPTGKVIVRHALLFDENHQAPLGSFFGLETRQFNAQGGLAVDKLVGTVLYSLPDQDTVFGATISTGGRINDTSGG